MIAPPKVILLLLLLWVVWYGMRWLNRPPARPMRRRPAGAAPPPQRAIEDLVACRVCGAYVATGTAGCGKPGCPQPR
ncbi:MAG TPA: hypothetical protein VHW90_08770 [Stellaceae bacterium]|jgi:hypothetical protein|nr:hypothetical protein [Stellaceae bacterium]